MPEVRPPAQPSSLAADLSAWMHQWKRTSIRQEPIPGPMGAIEVSIARIEGPGETYYTASVLDGAQGFSSACLADPVAANAWAEEAVQLLLKCQAFMKRSHAPPVPKGGA
jgi:hypothetical protein